MGSSMLVVTLFLVSLTPCVAASSGLAWAGAGHSEYGYGSAVAFSPDGEILASAHESTVMIVDTETKNTIQNFHVDFFVQSLDFSSNAQFLLIGMESVLPNTPATVVYEWVDGQYVRSMHTEDGINVNRISIAPDDNTFATATEEGDIAEWKINNGTGSNLDLVHTYDSTNSGDISCIDHSTDGAHLLSGSSDGVIVLWNRTDQSEITRWEWNHEITDCQFSNDGAIMSWIGGGSLYLRNHDATNSYFGQYDISPNASQISFLPDDREVAILSSDVKLPDYRRVDFVDFNTMPIQTTRTLYLGHKAVMMAIHPIDETIAISTQSKLVPFYSSSIPTESEIPTAVDTDQDNIPDSIDSDDDGDGILDIYDNICVAGTNCHLQPDQEFIRQFDISINGNSIVAIETVHLDAEQSSHLRVLAANALNNNHRVDNDEFAQMQYSICSEYDEIEIMTRWGNYLEIEGQNFFPTSVQCSIESGDLYGTMNSDRGTRVSISWFIEGSIPTSVQAPYNISILAGMPTPTASIAQNVHTFPIHVEIEDVSGTRIDYEVWNRRDADLSLLVDVPVAEEPGSIESVVDLLLSYWYAVVFIVIFAIATIWMGFRRHQNTVDFSDMDEGQSLHEETDDEWEQMVDDVAAWDEEMGTEVKQKKRPTPPAAVARDLRKKPKPPGVVQQDLENQKHAFSEVTHKVKRTRKTKSTDIEATGDSVGFAHLLETKAENSAEKVAEDDDMTDALAFITSKPDEKSKKRRPVRRKKSNKDD